MEGTEDYRFLASGDYQQTFFTDEDSFRLRVEKAKAGKVPTTHTIPVMMGRKLSLTATQAPDDVPSLVAYSSFSDLCARSLGAADYLALCRATKTIFLDGLHRFRARDLDYAKRFITLIDTAYEFGTRIFICSQDPLKAIFQEIVQVEHERSNSHSQMSVKKGGGSSSSMMSTFVNGDTEWSATGLADASLATGGAGETDVVFAIGRAISRLHEMGSSIYGQRD
jgi:protein AFG1